MIAISDLSNYEPHNSVHVSVPIITCGNLNKSKRFPSSLNVCTILPFIHVVTFSPTTFLLSPIFSLVLAIVTISLSVLKLPNSVLQTPIVEYQCVALYIVYEAGFFLIMNS